MPLRSGEKNIGYNIRELKEANKSKSEGKKRPHKQIVAIALSQALKKPSK